MKILRGVDGWENPSIKYSNAIDYYTDQRGCADYSASALLIADLTGSIDSHKWSRGTPAADGCSVFKKEAELYKMLID